MALKVSHSTNLENLKTALNSALDSIGDAKTPFYAYDGISLLDLKNELFISYLHNLVFLIILKIRDQKNKPDNLNQDLSDSAVRKLVELQLYIERGVRPLETRLKYQIEKVIQTANDAKITESLRSTKLERCKIQGRDEDSEDDSNEEYSESANFEAQKFNELQYRPNPALITRPVNAAAHGESKEENHSGIYKPPKIHAISMPTTKPQENKAQKIQKLATVDEFIYNEMSQAPVAEPNIGSTIVGGGRRSMSEKERNEEREKREYEEENYVRLPSESRKERAKRKTKRIDAGYGGEEWRGIGENLDRIERMTSKKSRGKDNLLERSRKRLNNDLNESGAVIGQSFRKRLKRLDKNKGQKRK